MPRLVAVVGALAVLTALAAVPANAQGLGLPRGYDVQRVDSPAPALSGGWGLGTVPIGDVNGDGEQDIATNQTEGTPAGCTATSTCNNEGQIWIISGETGGLLGTFTAPDAGNATNALNNNRALVDRWMDRLGDIGSCPANTPGGQTCTSAQVGPPDGRDDFFVGAEGVDVPTPGATPGTVRDAGRVYVIDGRTFSVLKRIDMPVADRLLLSQRQAQFPLPTTNVTGGLGRTATTPRGLPICTGNNGVTACPNTVTVPPGVRIGDLDAQSEIQRVTVSATSGNFTLTFQGQTTGNVAFNATAATVKAALDALANLAPADTTVTGGAGGPYTVTFTGAFTEVNVAEMTATDVDLAGAGDSVTVTTVRQGVPADKPEIVIGANRFTEIGSTAQPDSHCSKQADPNGICHDAGRVYIYRGEDVAGSDPSVILDGSGPGQTPPKVLRNPAASADGTDTSARRQEILGHAQFPIGDIGACRTGGSFGNSGPGDLCTGAARTNVPDGKADMIISSHRATAPIFNPDPSRFAEGISFMVDGATGAFLHVIHHPDPQPNALFGYTTRQSFAPGDLGGNTLPDMAQGAFQNASNKTQAGRLWLISGDFSAGFPVINILDDPTPTTNERFGIAREAVGDLVPGEIGTVTGGPEMLVGAFPSNVGYADAESDLHFMNARSGKELQRISDPDRQLSSNFGYQATPLGDLNEDGFLDFATSAPNWDSPAVGNTQGIRDQGRIYIYRSNNTPAATPPPPSSTTPPAPKKLTPAVVLAGRRISLSASKSRVGRGQRVTLRGRITALTNGSGCESGQTVTLQRRTRSRGRYRTFTRARTNRSGAYSKRIKPRRTYQYRARVPKTSRCLAASSKAKRVRVTRTRRRA